MNTDPGQEIINLQRAERDSERWRKGKRKRERERFDGRGERTKRVFVKALNKFKPIEKEAEKREYFFQVSLE